MLHHCQHTFLKYLPCINICISVVWNCPCSDFDKTWQFHNYLMPIPSISFKQIIYEFKNYLGSYGYQIVWVYCECMYVCVCEQEKYLQS